ncbi:tetratricopeptide repeat protein [Luteitalea sp.]
MPDPRLAGLLAALLLTLQTPTDWRAIPIDSYPTEARAQIVAARDAAVASPDSAAAAGHLGLVLHAWEQFDLAAEAYAGARRLAPRDAEWWALSGTLATRMGRHDLAADYFGTAAALAPSPLLVLRHADALLDSGQLDAARTVYQRAVTMREAEPAARYGLGRLATTAGDLATARAELARAITLVPTFGAAHYALAQVQRRQGDLAGARDSLRQQQQCLACWPMPDDPYTSRVASVRDDAPALLAQAVKAAAGADDARAIALHEGVLEKDPDSLQARTNLITLYARTGNLARAEAEYRRVIASGTQLSDAHRAFGLALVAANQLAAAAPILSLAVEANPHDAQAFNALGLVHETQTRLADAEASYRQAAVAAPDVRGYRFNLARVLVGQRRLDEALELLRPLARRDDAESAQYVYATSVVLVRKGDIAAGRQTGEEALARARRHGLDQLAAVIERDLQKLQ